MRFYDDYEIRDILSRAQELGLPLEKGSWLEKLTIGQLDSLVSSIDRKVKKFLMSNHRKEAR